MILRSLTSWGARYVLLYVQVPIREAAEVEQVFDAISYCKGGAIVRMAHAVVGEAAFLAGLQAYMGQFKYVTSSS